jgi:hypothetical protein
VVVLATAASAQERPLQVPSDPGSTSYLVFLRQQPIGREEVAVVRNAEG